jgi:hypothetical protein
MTLFGKRALRKAEDLDKEVNRLKAQNTESINKVTDSSARLHQLLKSNGITLRIYVATGGDKRHA